MGTEPDTFRDLVRLFGLAVTLFTCIRVALTWRTGDRAASIRAVALVVGCFVVLCPVVHLWYFLAVLRLRRDPRPVSCRDERAAGGLGGLGLVAPLDSSLHGAYLAIVLGCMTLGVLLAVLLLTRRARERIDRIASARWLVLR